MGKKKKQELQLGKGLSENLEKDAEEVPFPTPKKNPKCDKGWHTGECCCNCRYQIELFKHPGNKTYKGSIMESTGMYVCIGGLDLGGSQKGTLFEDKHGYCELYKPKT